MKLILLMRMDVGDVLMLAGRLVPPVGGSTLSEMAEPSINLSSINPSKE